MLKFNNVKLTRILVANVRPRFLPLIKRSNAFTRCTFWSSGDIERETRDRESLRSWQMNKRLTARELHTNGDFCYIRGLMHVSITGIWLSLWQRKESLPLWLSFSLHPPSPFISRRDYIRTRNLTSASDKVLYFLRAPLMGFASGISGGARVVGASALPQINVLLSRW